MFLQSFRQDGWLSFGDREESEVGGARFQADSKLASETKAEKWWHKWSEIDCGSLGLLGD